MADENQSQTTEQMQGNNPQAREADGTMKDQSPSIQQSGDQKTETKDPAQQQTDGKSFLNTKPAEKVEDGKTDAKDGKTEDGKKEGEDVKSGAPEKYEDFKLPEGYKLNEEVGKQATAIFKELGLSQEGAQKLVDLYAKNGLEAAQAPYKLWADTQKSWVTEIESRFGSKADTMRTDINKAIDVAITSPKLRNAFREALDMTGAGSNPDFFEALSVFAKPFLEGTAVRGNAPAPAGQKAPGVDTRPSAAEAMYPHLIQNRGQT